MDDDVLNMRNWGYYEPTFKGNLGLQLMSTMGEHDTKHFLPSRDPGIVVTTNSAFHPRDYMISDPSVHHMNYVRDSWVSQREKFLNMVSPPPCFSVYPETSASNPMQMLQPPACLREERATRVDEVILSKEVGGQVKRSSGPVTGVVKPPSSKKPRKPKDTTTAVVQPRVKAPKKSMAIVVNGINMDISTIPIPVCTCTGSPRQCYRWGCGGWQSACCTTSLSMYPLPMSAKRRGARIAGRKMSQGAFKKVLEKLATEKYDFSSRAIDLRTHWARHGTNKFVTIR